MRVLVCGGREFGKVPTHWGYMPDPEADAIYELKVAELKFIYATLTKELGQPLADGTLRMCQGGATGADQGGYDWAIHNDVPCATYPADWNRFGNKAGSIRNKQMLDDFKPTLVIAFPGGVGTAHMVRIAKKAGVPVREFSPPCAACVTGNEDVF